MTPESVRLVQESWAKIEPLSESAGYLFYGRLIEVNPELKQLFKQNVSDQGRRLIAMIGTAVKELDNLDPFIPAMKDMGARHGGYGVKNEDYFKFADALFWTLEQCLGEDFTPNVKVAWVGVFRALADTMQTGAAEAAQGKPRKQSI